MNNEKIEGVEPKDPKEKELPQMRQIIIETDGDNIHLVKAEVSGKIELMGILNGIIGYLNRPEKK